MWTITVGSAMVTFPLKDMLYLQIITYCQIFFYSISILLTSYGVKFVIFIFHRIVDGFKIYGQAFIIT